MPAAPAEADASIEEVVEKLNDEAIILCESGEFSQAIRKYQKAIAAGRNSPCILIPFNNLTAALFELGKYKSCIELAKRGWNVTRNLVPEDKVAIERFELQIQKAQALIPKASKEEKFQRRLKVAASLPRHCVSMDETRKCFPVEENVPESLFHELFSHSPRIEDRKISFFLGGIGDARHLYATMLHLHDSEKDGIAPIQRYHFVANDPNIFALTKFLIIWKLLTGFSKISIGQNLDPSMGNLAAILFICDSRIIPQYIYSILRDTMENILATISKGGSSLEWLIINKSDIPKYIAVLNHWLGIKEFETLAKSNVLQGTQDQFSKLELSPREDCENEAEFYAKYGSLSPHEKILISSDRELLKLLERNAESDEIRCHIRAKWRFNPVMMNLDTYRDMQRSVLWEKLNCGNDPYDALSQLEMTQQGQSSLRLFKDTISFFQRTAAVAVGSSLMPRFCVELLYGDVVEISEWLRFGVSNTKIPRWKRLPNRFDIIYLNHLPDNIGGHLSKLLYLTPLLRYKQTSVLKSKFSRNIVSWDSTKTFLADCQCIMDKTMLEKLTQVEVVSEPGKDDLFPLTRYTCYRPTIPRSKSHSPNSLPRIEFARWFYGLFFRLALPYNVNIYPQNTIHLSPINLTILFPLMNHLCSLHYPPHWIAEALLSIIENNVVSTCRPPRMMPATASALKEQHEERHLCTIPFYDEMATLTRIFVPLLPFNLESSSLPAQNDIYRYTFHLPGSKRYPEWPINLALIFWCDKYLVNLGDMGRQSFMNNIRPLLDPTWGDEMNSQFKGANFDTFRKKGLIIWSTIELNVQTWKVKVWMPSPLVDFIIQRGEKNEESKWYCGLFRTDTWEKWWDYPGLVSDAEKGEKWEDDVVSAGPLYYKRISEAALKLMDQKTEYS
ncbi:hypothetical protein EYC80_001535 [Monilinia laxa]|uniref:DUF4470 domain-containing protein n=1 Tax=Monilinia laxa TaxID=61186 RepID=A0A5N6K579_MONLA|nr:hypothetical protein EYC80_001535 [Monilinia laxa]